ncbi:cation diffusion facilitator family transporter [Enterococcus hirae]|jgi:cation diffusion facilitator family transporter|nr:cation diffusion facilitator family transporter [Enterococcaceae bacterium]MCI1919534.1 cation diffusion facilitator family transporter [Enterococcaceae bacterium]MDM8213405.1 cation diffusion facilitator family transporter [Enterococcus hirae]
MEDRYKELKRAERGAIVSICAYIFVSGLKLAVGYLAKSEALQADGLNNLTDIIGSVTLLIGLKISQVPADKEHRYGHWKAENIASMITSFIMLLVGLQVLTSAVKHILSRQMESPDISAALVGLVSAVIMYAVYFYNLKLSKSVKSPALLAAAKDNRSDAWTSIGTAIAVFAASFNLPWLDTAAAIVIGGLIIKTGIDVFRENAFSLSDGFDDETLDEFKVYVKSIPGVVDVPFIRGRSYGANVFLDIVLTMDPNMTVRDSHHVTETVEHDLKNKFSVYDIDIHVEPAEK